MAHTYHTKVPYRAIVRYIMHYTQPGDLVLDCFAGSGMTGVAAQACERPPMDLQSIMEKDGQASGRQPLWGRRYAVLVDLSPFACFLARNFTSCTSTRDVASEAHRLLDASLLPAQLLARQELREREFRIVKSKLLLAQHVPLREFLLLALIAVAATSTRHAH